MTTELFGPVGAIRVGCSLNPPTESRGKVR
jgi:hypothetical protein